MRGVVARHERRPLPAGRVRGRVRLDLVAGSGVCRGYRKPRRRVAWAAVEHLAVALTIFTVTTIALCVGGYLWVRHRIRRKLRVSPAVRSPAPTLWLVSMWEPAQLHRRLRRAAGVARSAAVMDRHGPV